MNEYRSPNQVDELNLNNNYQSSPEAHNNQKNTTLPDESKVGKMTYICSGSRVCGESSCVLITTYNLLIIPSILFYAVVIPSYDDTAAKVILAIVSALTLIVDMYYLYDVSTTSPGYIPRSNLSLDEYMKKPQIKIIKGLEVELKFCETCMNVRGPRSFHCNICGNCIEKHDHHCPWIGNCVGGKNIRIFYKFLISVFVHATVIFTGSLIAFIRLINDYNDEKEAQPNEEHNWDYKLIISLLVLLLSGLAVFLMIIAVSHQSYLIANNITTNECLRARLPPNTFDEGCSKNWREVWEDI
mmetsp:Transcript_354/g.339  ORF Transcript_354/g.339 Transcript_354/m.339 type:complete len:299 (+) Transcript_354:6-902(+)